jgi:hypothetical protein
MKTMRPPARFVTCMAAIVVAMSPAAMFALGTQTAAASPPDRTGPATVPLAGILRRCDHSANTYTGPAGFARAFAVISTTKSNTVAAEVHLETAVPNTRYDVSLIQAPRPSSQRCGAGDPGTAVGMLNTDAAGNGVVTLQDAIDPGTTGVWVFVSRPQAFSQIPAEFYTSDFVLSI